MVTQSGQNFTHEGLIDPSAKYNRNKKCQTFMTDHDLNDLDPRLKPIAEKCLADWVLAYPDRHPVKITVTWRSNADQQAAYNAHLSNCKAGEGMHNCTIDGKPASKAFDYACFDDAGHYITNGSNSYYADFGDIAVANGLIWGGDWHGWKDFDHCELPDDVHPVML